VSLSDLRRALTRTYLTIDPRSLGLCRIGIGLVLIVNLVRRVPLLRDFYTNAGLLPNHTVLWKPPLPRLLSVFFPVSLGHEAWLMFAICFFCFFCLMIGWRTRLFHVLSFVLVVSLHNRVLFAENWGGVALGALMAWTAFLPLGRRFSVDAVLGTLRRNPSETPEDMTAERLAVTSAPDARLVVSLAVLGVLLQLGVIYWFNFVHKSGPTWKHGTAVHYVLWQERIVTTLGLWVRMHAPPVLAKAFTYATLVVESSAPFLILTPVLWRWTRPLAILTLSGLHVGIALLVNLGVFSWAMLAYYPLLLDTVHWDFFRRHVPMRGRRRTVFYDAGCGICFQVVRVLARLDVYRRLTWISNQDRAALPADVDPALLERTILVVDPARGRRWTRSDAFAQIFAALPLGRFWAWIFLVPGLRALAGRGYDLVARNRTTISTWLGLAACGLPGAARPAAPVEPEPTPLRAWVRGRLPLLRELAVGFVMFVFAAELSVANAAIPPKLRWDRRPDWMMYLVMYPHIFQSWSMFSPDAPLSDEMIVIDAVTRDGRHVDPFNQVASRVAALPVAAIPPRLGNDSLFCDYALRIPDNGFYHQALLEWVQRYPERTGHPSDEIVSFEAWKIEQTSPPPGEKQPTDVRRRLFLSWRQGQ
jgi:predicted DCC family thiol-disulfide oxidoreductase YuxK